MNNLRKMWGVIPLLASIMAISDSASAINLSIGNTTYDANLGNNNSIGQSFINDPAGSGASILLNDWTFAYQDTTTASDALTKTLSIYSGGGNGGTLLYSSTATTSVTFAGFNSVKWAFTGASLTDNATYTAVLLGFSSSGIKVSISGTNPYFYGSIFNVTTPEASYDAVFQANFSSATPVPFEFEPTGGVLILGSGWLLRRHLKKKKSTKV